MLLPFVKCIVFLNDNNPSMEAILEIRQNNCLLSGKHLSIEAIPIYKKFPLKCQFLLQRRHHLNYKCFFFQKLYSCYMSSFPFSTFLCPAETSAEPHGVYVVHSL